MRFAILASAITLAITIPAASEAAVTSVQIKSLANDYLQVAELQLFEKGTGTDVALGGVATATSRYNYYANDSAPINAIDGNLAGTYPNIYHSGLHDGSDVLTVTLSGAFNIDRISIFGRTDSCCGFRDLYSYTLFDGAAVTKTGTLDARQGAFATAAVPEPAMWGLMIAGFAMIGTAMRKRATTVAA